MSYQNAIPQPGDKISISQGDLLGNFQEVNTAWNANHVPFNLSNEGSHWFISMPNQTPSATFPPRTDGVGIYANAIGLYNSGGNLWFRPAGQAVGDTTNDFILTGLAGKNAMGWCMLPGNMKMAWGQFGVVAGTPAVPGTQTLSFDNINIPTFPGFTQIYNVQVSSMQFPFASLTLNVWFTLSQPVLPPAPGSHPGRVTVLNPNNGQIAAYVLAIGY